MIAFRLSLLYAALFAVVGVQQPFWPVWLQAAGLNATDIGLVLALSIGIKMVSAPAVAHLADRSGERKRLITMDRFSLLAIIAASEALRDAGIAIDASNATRVGAVVGVGVFGVECIEDNYRGILVEGRPRANVFTVPRSMPSAPAGQISMEYGLRGPVFAVTSACCSQHMLVHCAPWLFRASVNAVATTSVAVALINSQVPASA